MHKLIKIDEKIYAITIYDQKTRYFEGIWRIPEGITYNSYLYLGDEVNILFDTVKRDFSKELIEAIRKVIDPKDVDSVVIHHMEPDHTSGLKDFLEANKWSAEIWSHPLSLKMIKAFYKIDVKFRNLKDLETINIGDEEIRVIHTPWLHWPETIMTYMLNRRILFSGDAFGGYSIPEETTDKILDEGYIRAIRKYLATVIGFYRPWIIKNIEKLDRLHIKPSIIAPAHGKIWVKDPVKIVELYRSWAEAEPINNKIVVIYGTMYGGIENLVNEVVSRLSEKRFNVIVYSFNEEKWDCFGDILGDILDSKLIIIASPVYEGKILPHIEYLINLMTRKTDSPKEVILISSYGWSKVGGKYISKLLEGSRFRVVDIIEYHVTHDPKILDRIVTTIDSKSEK